MIEKEISESLIWHAMCVVKQKMKQYSSQQKTKKNFSIKWEMYSGCEGGTTQNRKLLKRDGM